MFILEQFRPKLGRVAYEHIKGTLEPGFLRGSRLPVEVNLNVTNPMFAKLTLPQSSHISSSVFVQPGTTPANPEPAAGPPPGHAVQVTAVPIKGDLPG